MHPVVTNTDGEMHIALSPVSLTGAEEAHHPPSPNSLALVNQTNAQLHSAMDVVPLSPLASSPVPSVPSASLSARPDSPVAVEASGEAEENEDEWTVVVPQLRRARFTIRENDWARALTQKPFRFCVWGLGHVCKVTFFSYLDVAFGPHRACVQKVRQVSQRDGQVRYDVFIVHNNVSLVEECMSKLTSVFHAFARQHIPYNLRLSSRSTSLISLDTLSVCSLNINGLTNKKLELSFFLNANDVDVCLLQETLRFSSEVCKKLTYLSGYNVCEVGRTVDERGNARGLAIAVRNGLQARELPWACNVHCMAVEIRCPNATVVVISFYSPSTNPIRKQAYMALQDCLQKLRTRRPNAMMLLGGDFNARSNDKIVGEIIQTVGMSAPEFNGPNTTYYHGLVAKSPIDYFLVNNTAANKVSTVKVMEEGAGISDHRAIRISVYVGEKGQRNAVGGIRKLNMQALATKKENILGHNAFAPNSNEQVEVLEETVDLLIEKSKEVAKDLGCFKSPALRRRANSTLTKKTRQAIVAKHRLASTLSSSQQVSDADNAAFGAECRKVKAMIKKDSNAGWRRHILKVTAKRTEQAASYWRDLSSLAAGPRRSATSRAMCPVVPLGSNEAVFDESSIVTAWTEYYASLSHDPTRALKDEHYWMTTFTNLPQLSTLDTVDEPLHWREVQEALSRAHPTKAAGPSGLQACWWQVVLEENVDSPTSPLGKVMFLCLCKMWDLGYIPECLRSALLVNILKSGDKTDMSNYRGISLCETLLKVLTSIVANRLQDALNNSRRLRSEQAGFRRREECMGHVLALLEICNRRQSAGAKTVVAFLDFKKAFDMVPTLALLEKVKKLGVSGRALRFISALYSATSVAVRKTDGTAGPRVEVERGVRQGCPLSPILFDIFINDMFDGCEGVNINTSDEEEQYIPGLLFADDAVVLANNAEAMQVTFNILSDWAQTNGMQFGISKCGVMTVGGEEDLGNLPVKLHLGGAEVPIVDVYKYLGFPFYRSTNLLQAAAARAASATKAIGASTAFLANPSIPLLAKLDVLRSKLFPILSYGGEILGMNKSLVTRLDSKWTACVRKLTASAGFCGAEVLMRELGLIRVFEAMSAARGRAFQKYPTLLSSISLLSTPSAGSLWAKAARRWMRSNKVNIHAADLADAVHAAVNDRAWEQATSPNTNSSRKGAIDYDNSSFFPTRSYISHFSRKRGTASLDAGLTMLIAARCGGFFTGDRAARRGYLRDEFKTRCPCCNMAEAETLADILLRCAEWTPQRKRYLRPLLRSIPPTLAPLSSVSRVTLLLGGSISEGHANFRLTRWSTKLFLPVIRFFQSISIPRCIFFSAGKSPSPHGNGSPSSSSG